MNIPQFGTLRDLFTYSTDTYKNNPAFSYINGQSYTYGEFAEKTAEVSQILASYGVNPDEKVAILSQNMPNWPVAYFAATAFGRVAVPLLPDFSEFEVKNIIEHSESTALFISKRLIYKAPEELLSKFKVVIEIDSLTPIRGKIAEKAAEVKVSQEEELAVIIYTSGTTGNSKGVMLSHSNLCKHLYSAYLLRPGYDWDVWLSLLPLSHTLESSLCLLLPMMSGSRVYYIEKAPTPTILLNALKESRPTTILSVPMIIEKIYRNSVLPKFNASPITRTLYKTTLGRKLLNKVAGKKLMKTFGGKIRFFGIGGAKLDPEVERFLHEANFPYAIGYGLTETSPLLAGAVVGKTKLQSTGPSVYGVTLKINDPNPETGEGEIVAKGPNVMMGYYKNPEATEQAFTKDGWFRTKDLGIFDKKGRLFIKGRLNNMILGPSGENIYPEEIESIINGHSMVAESLVTLYDGKLVAHVHFNPDKLKALKEAKDEAIATYYKTKEELMHTYDEKKEELKKAFEEKKEEFSKTKEELMHTYDEKKDEIVKAFHEKIDHLKKEVYDYVNARVNKFSKINVIVDHPEQFEKTATHKIKRYKYTDKTK